MDSQNITANNIPANIEKEYKNFLAQLTVFKKEQQRLIREYREKLEWRKLPELRERLVVKE